jgi:hypothetical protein
MEKRFTIFFKLMIDCILNFMQFEYHFIFHQTPLKLDDNFNGLNLIAFDGISNNIQLYEI